jgi:hypothetical protein
LLVVARVATQAPQQIRPLLPEAEPVPVRHEGGAPEQASKQGLFAAGRDHAAAAIRVL